MMIAHKIELAPNNRQATYFEKAAGCARKAYNWALAEWNRQYDAHRLDNSLPKPNEAALRKALNAIKREQFPWMYEVTKCAPQMAIKQLGQAFANYFAMLRKIKAGEIKPQKRKKKRKDGKPDGYPCFRRKGLDDRFTVSNDQFSLDGSRIRIPNLGWVRMRERLRFAGKPMSATISKRGGRWFVSICVETEHSPRRPAENQGAGGADFGLKADVTLSTGEVIKGPKPHKALLVRMRRLSRSLSRKQRVTVEVKQPDGTTKTVKRDSKNRAKAKLKLAKLHKRIADIRGDFIHKTTTELTRRFHTLGIEDLNVRGMMKNHHLARSIADVSFFEIRRQLEYKAAMRGAQIVVADQWFPSSKQCSACGYKMAEMSLKVRRWQCPCCAAEHDRDVNAAINLKNMAESLAATACGEVSAGLGCAERRTQSETASMKQEVAPGRPGSAGALLQGGALTANPTCQVG